MHPSISIVLVLVQWHAWEISWNFLNEWLNTRTNVYCTWIWFIIMGLYLWNENPILVNWIMTSLCYPPEFQAHFWRTSRSNELLFGLWKFILSLSEYATKFFVALRIIQVHNYFDSTSILRFSRYEFIPIQFLFFDNPILLRLKAYAGKILY